MFGRLLDHVRKIFGGRRPGGENHDKPRQIGPCPEMFLSAPVEPLDRMTDLGRRWLAVAAAAFILQGVVPAFAADVADIRSTDLRLADWSRMAEADRPWFIVGFSLGWHDAVPEGGPLSLAATHAAAAAAAARIGERAADPAAEGSRLVAALLHEQVAGRLPRGEIRGYDWTDFDPSTRFAVLHGFHGGVYARAVWRALGEAADDAALDAALSRARRLVAPPLALAPSLLYARLADYYFYTDRRGEPLTASIAVIAGQIRTP